MKKLALIFLIVFLLGGIQLNAQKRSKLPRVTVETPVKKIQKAPNSNHLKKETTSSVAPVTPYIQEESKIADEHVVAIKTNHQNQSEFDGMIQQTRSIIEHKNLQSANIQKSSFTFSGAVLKTHTTLLKVKEVEKTAIELWVILMIVFSVLAVVFIILCLLAIYLWGNITLFIVFLILGIVFSLASSILITLAQMGIL